MRFTSPTPAPCRRKAPHATARPSSRAMNTVVFAWAICSTVICEQNSGGVIASRCSLSAAISRAHVVLQRALDRDRQRHGAQSTQPTFGLRRSSTAASIGDARAVVSRVGCDVCHEVTGEIELPGGALWDDELVLGFHVPPLLEPRPLLGHLVVVPSRHADTCADLTYDDASRIGLAAARLARPLAP